MERGWGQAGNGHAVRPPQSKEKQGQAGRASLSWESLVILVELCYPGTAHCFFAQEPVEVGGEREWDHTGTPQQRWAGGDPLSLTPQRGAPPCAPLKTTAPLALPPRVLLALTADPPPNLSILTRKH